MQMSWLDQQQKMDEVNRKERGGMNYMKSRSGGVRQQVYVLTVLGFEDVLYLLRA